MTTSKTIHHKLVSLAQQGRRSKYQPPSKRGRHGSCCTIIIDRKVVAQRIVALSKVVLGGSSSSSRAVTMIDNQRIIARRAEEGDDKTRPVESTDASSAEKDTTTTTTTAAAGSADINSYYTQEYERLTQDIRKLENDRLLVAKRQTEFWDVYKYALTKVSKLNDLRDAPDAILPGNFVPIVAEKDEEMKGKEKKDEGDEEVSAQI